MTYQLLKDGLPLGVGTSWLEQDAKDDFYPDPIGYRDIAAYQEDFLALREHEIFQIHNVPFWKPVVPKSRGMLREAVFLHPSHRVLYLSVLRHFLPKLDARLLAEAYSYRHDTPGEPDRYPFGRRIDRWKDFQNDFRTAALDDACGAVLLTDLAAFYDHISCEALVGRILALLPPPHEPLDEAVADLLKRLLLMWGHDGHNLPQNYDPSSFFGSLYLHEIDKEMSEGGARYFRWVDDIRLVAENRKETLKELHRLQRTLGRHRLFLQTAKTDIVEKGTPRFAKLMDVSDDVLIGRAEDVIASADCDRISELCEELFERLEFHGGPNGFDRKFRAIANRLLAAAAFPDLAQDILQRLQGFVLPRLGSHPERSDYWVRMLVAYPSSELDAALVQHLHSTPSLFDWQRFHLWRLANSLPGRFSQELERAAHREADRRDIPQVAAQAIVCLGHKLENDTRQQLFGRHFTAQRSYPVQRAVLIATQELPSAVREPLYARAVQMNRQHTELVRYLSELKEPDYGALTPLPQRACAEEPEERELVIASGVGLVEGARIEFRLTTDFVLGYE